MTPLPTSPRTWFTTYLQVIGLEGKELLDCVDDFLFLNTTGYDFEQSTFLLTTGGAAGVAELKTVKDTKRLLVFGNGKALDNVLDVAEHVYNVEVGALCSTIAS